MRLRRQIALAALALATLPACAAAPESASVAPAAACTPGTFGMVGQTPRDRAQIAAAVAALGDTVTLVAVTERSDKPTPLNGPEAARMMERAYPPHLRDAGRSGEVTLLMQISESGGVSQLSVHKGAIERAFDTAALQVAATLRFKPARYRGCAIPVWVLLPIGFHVSE